MLMANGVYDGRTEGVGEVSSSFQSMVSDQLQNCFACDFPLTSAADILAPPGSSRRKLCQACRKFFYRHSLKKEERLELAPCMCKFKIASSDSVTSASTSCRSHIICKSCRYRRCLRAGFPDDKTAALQTASKNNGSTGCKFEQFDESGDDDDAEASPNRQEVESTLMDVSQLPCTVCGWPATGIHFGAVSCDACKAFYGRFARRCQREGVATFSSNSFCLTGGKCFDNDGGGQVTQNRMRCASCRIKKCIGVGMSPLGSVAGRRSRAQKRAISEAVKGLHSHSQKTPGKPRPTEVVQAAVSELDQLAQSYLTGEPTDRDCNLNNGNERRLSRDQNSQSQSSNESLISPSSASTSFASTSCQKYRQLVEIVRQSKNNSDTNGTNIIWLYNSGAGFINLDELRANGYSSLPHHMDPLRLYERFLAKSHAQLPYLQQMSLEWGSRAEWLIGRVVNATKILSKMSTLRCYANETMGPAEIWRSILDNFVFCFKYVLQFVRALPGFDWLQNLPDRILLFTSALFPILCLQTSVDYDAISRKSYVFNLDKESCQIAKSRFAIVARAEPVVRDSGISLKNANLNIAEYGIVAALLFFDPNVNGLGEADKVRMIADDYWMAAEMLAGQSSPLNPAQRINILTQQVRVFGHYTVLTMRLMEACKMFYPSLAGIEPLLDEVTSQLAKIQISPRSSTSSLTHLMASPTLSSQPSSSFS